MRDSDDPALTAAREAAEPAIAAEILARPNAIECGLFGTIGYLVDDRLVAFWSGDRLVLKPPPDRRAELLAAGLAVEFEIRPGKAFGTWIAVSPLGVGGFRDLVATAADFVLDAPRRPGRRRASPRRIRRA